APQRQPLQRMQPIDLLVIHRPPVPPQEDPQALVAIADTHRRQLPQAYPQCGLVLGSAAIAEASNSDDPTGTSFTDPKANLPKSARTRAAGSVSQLVSECLLHHVPVQHQIGDELLQLAVLVCALAEAPQLGEGPPSRQISASSD